MRDAERLHRRTNAIHGVRRVLRGLLRKNDDELLAAVAIHSVARAHRVAQRGGDLLERDVAREMPVAIVVRLERVDIADGGAVPMSVAHGVRGECLEVLVEAQTIRDERKRIGARDAEGLLAMSFERAIPFVQHALRLYEA